ncbi:MAG TPA: hypothetical protein VGM88_29595 [Kofleriaceae bacterium]|jgi:hypothetical protein
MTSAFGDDPAAGAFVQFADEPCRWPTCCVTLIEDLLESLELAEGDVQLAVSKRLDWRAFSWAALEKAIANPDRDELRILVGTPADVQLAAELQTRHWLWLSNYRDEPERWRQLRPPTLWMYARSARWPAARVRTLALRWFRTAAMLGSPLSGGATRGAVAEDLRNEVSLQRSHTELEPWLTQPLDRALFDEFLGADSVAAMHRRIRRLYPVSLLGPRFTTPRNIELLRAAGAEVEQVKDCLIVTTALELVSAWDPDYMGKTAALRKLAWPISIQNPIDYEGLGPEHSFEMKTGVRPRYPTPDEMRAAMAAFREAVAARMPATVPDAGLELAEEKR